MTQTSAQYYVDGFDIDTPVGTPIEIHLMTKWIKRNGWPRDEGEQPEPADRQNRYVYTLWVDGHGIIQHSLDNGRGGPSLSVSNLQLKQIVPKKAVPGWQGEAVNAADSGLYNVEEIR